MLRGRRSADFVESPPGGGMAASQLTAVPLPGFLFLWWSPAVSDAKKGRWWSAEHRCVSMGRLEHWRTKGDLPEGGGRRLVAHLTEGCGRCWAALEGLAPFEQRSKGIPVLDPALESSLDPVVWALRTMGGWPSRRWLRPRHRKALGGVREPAGFLALVLEEALRIARGDSGLPKDRVQGLIEPLLEWVAWAEKLAEETTAETSPPPTATCSGRTPGACGSNSKISRSATSC